LAPLGVLRASEALVAKKLECFGFEVFVRGVLSAEVRIDGGQCLNGVDDRIRVHDLHANILYFLGSVSKAGNTGPRMSMENWPRN